MLLASRPKTSKQTAKFDLLLALVNRQTGNHIERVTDDKGGEYTALSCMERLQRKGIVHRITALGSPRIRVCAKLSRKLGCPMLHAAKLPNRF